MQEKITNTKKSWYKMENINMEFLALKTSQKNGIVERVFATLFGRVQAIMNYASSEGNLCQKLWAEWAKTTSELDGILIQKRGEKSKHKKIFGTTPKYLCWGTYSEIFVVLCNIKLRKNGE